MTRVEQIIHNARLTLADPDKQRWDDPILLSLLNEGIQDFNRQTRLLHANALIELAIGKAEIQLPADCWQITRVTYQGRALKLVSFSELDSTKLDWAKDRGEPGALIYNLRNMQEARLYPALSFEKWNTESVREVYPDVMVDSFGSISGGIDVDVFPALGLVTHEIELYGFLTPEELIADLDTGEPFGILTQTADPNKPKTVTGPFGVYVDGDSDKFGVAITVERHDYSTGITVIVGSTEHFAPFGCIVDINPAHVMVQYLKIPGYISDLEGTPDTPAMYDNILKFYVVGQAYLHDIETGSQQKGAQQMMIYERHVGMVKQEVRNNWVKSSQAYPSTYRRGV